LSLGDLPSNLGLDMMEGSMDRDASIRFYFSFRSPYAWFAAERLEAELGAHARAIAPVPMYPTPDTFPNDPTRVPNKIKYIAQDVVRLCGEFGLRLQFPPAIDTDWGKAHAAYLGAVKLGRGMPFMLELFRSRFGLGLDVGLDAVIEDAAARAEVDAAAVLLAAHDPELQAEVARNFKLGQERDGIFGVPSFVYAKQLFWGQDRMRFLRAAVDRAAAAP
jgi:2-hydroxychromene-2-carboxylate isomerase